MSNYVDMNNSVIADKYLHGNFIERLWLTKGFVEEGESIDWFATTEFIFLIALFLLLTSPLWKRLFKFLFYKFLFVKCKIKYIINRYRSIEFFSIKITCFCKHYDFFKETKPTDTFENIKDATFEEIE